MKPVRIFRHVTCEGPGYLSDFLSSRDNPTEIICIDAGDTVPDGLDDVAAQWCAPRAATLPPCVPPGGCKRKGYWAP